MPSAATSDGSQSEWSTSGRLNDEALGRDRHVDAKRVHRDVERAQLVRGRHREVFERGLRHAVGHQAGEVVEPGDRRDVEDRSGAPRLHRGHHAADREQRRAQVDLHHEVEALHVEIEIAGERDRGVVHEHVDAARTARRSPRPSVRPRRRWRGWSARRSPSPPASVIRRTVSSIVPGIGSGAASVGARRAHDLAAALGEQQRGGGTDAAARARDDRDLAVELHAQRSLPARARAAPDAG